MKRWLTVSTLALLAAGCDHESVTGPDTSAFEAQRADSPALNVMTYNIYVGARFEDLLLVEDPNEIPFKAAEVFAAVQATDFHERAEAIADQIERTRPHLIGLQEAALYRIQSPGDFVLGNPQPATDPVLDYLGILSDALAARGLEYDRAATLETFDVELPIVNFQTGGLDDIRMTERIAILARSDLDWSGAQGATFAAVLPIDLGIATIEKPSGWASIDVTFKGLPYRFVNTHLEPADIAPDMVHPQLAALQAAQLAELLAVVDGSDVPVIMVGDFNSDADGGTTPTYGDVLAAGFVDAWEIGEPRGTGYTANQAPDLLNATSQLFHRIDFVFYRDEFTGETGQFQGTVHARRAGVEQSDRTPSGLWPSDHAGVFASLVIAPGLGHTD